MDLYLVVTYLKASIELGTVKLVVLHVHLIAVMEELLLMLLCLGEVDVV